MEYTHAKTGWKLILNELTQGMAEKFEELYRADTGGGVSQDVGRVVRSAIQAGWIQGVTIDEVAAMKPAQVRWMGKQCDAVYTEAVTIPPE